MKRDALDTPAGMFERDRIGWWLVAMNLLAAANSTLYFTTQLKSGLDGWLAMNSCALSIFVFSLGYILRSRVVMAVGSGLMLRYGMLGLFAFGWAGMNIIPQVGHILMTLALLYFIIKMIRRGGWGEIVVCLAIPVVMIYAGWQADWLNARPQLRDGLFNGELKPEMFR